MAHLYKHARISQIFGSNTDVGKTIITAALVQASALKGRSVRYLKPVSTGALEDADDKFIERHTLGLKGAVEQSCLYRFDEPVSPHLAYNIDCKRKGHQNKLKDSDVLDRISGHLSDVIKRGTNRTDVYIETAGGTSCRLRDGVLSPSLTGSSQADFYRPLRLPTILVGDSKLGGISTTITAYESLVLRGYSIDAIVLFKEDFYSNWKYLQEYFSERNVFVAAVQPPPPKIDHADGNFRSTEIYFDQLHDKGVPGSVVEHLDAIHTERIVDLDSMAERTMNKIWWPFVQHGLVKDRKDVTVIDSAYGDFFSVYTPSNTSDARAFGDNLRKQFDGSASWWTQTFGHAHPKLALAAAKAAGRYGHVMFPQASHEPALKLAERLLQDGPGKGWASRVFYSDDGSTAIEVALKMALRAYCLRHGRHLSTEDKQQLGVLGLKGSYHGDTIGAMDACEKADGVYTCEWHSAKGFWIDPPHVAVRAGKPTISLPNVMHHKYGPDKDHLQFDSLTAVYDVRRRLHTPLADFYRSYIQKYTVEDKLPHLAALILEPLVMGAGGMIFVDPLFQRILVDVFRNADKLSRPHGEWRNLPVIFDEVFVGLYRTGWESCIPVLGVTPDIAVYAKMLTGGLVPLATTLASKSIFEAFTSDSKAEALLHGHSYTAHAVGCEVANASLSMMKRLEASDEWKERQRSWAVEGDEDISSATKMWSHWSPTFVNGLSCTPSVESAMTLGTILAIRFKAEAAGYQSAVAQRLLRSIVNADEPDGVKFGIHHRTLGDVAYFMSSLNTPSGVLRSVEDRVLRALHDNT